jgi:hypothetical protein
MSNPLAVPAVTGALWSILVDAFSKLDVEAPPIVSVGPLDDRGVIAEGPCVGIHLYRATRFTMDSNLPTRRSPATDQPAALNLHYLLTFRGQDEWQSQHLLAAAAVALHAEPVLTAARLAVMESDHPEFVGHDLADAKETVRFTADELTIEELIRLWALYPPGSFALTLAVTAGPVLLDLDG